MTASIDDVAAATAPKSDQLNADDLSGGRTLDVRIVATKSYKDDKGQTRIACRLDGHARVFRPCTTVVRLLVACWGQDSRLWIGRWIRLYTDPEVMYGRDRVGGLRISHASDLDGPVTAALSERRGSRRVWTVHPMVPPSAPVVRALADVLTEAGLTEDQVDGWLATRGRPPVADLDAGQREQLADYLLGDAGRVEAIRGSATGPDQGSRPMSAAEIAAIESDEKA